MVWTYMEAILTTTWFAVDLSSQLADDEMVGNLLHWIQQTIQQKNRKGLLLLRITTI